MPSPFPGMDPFLEVPARWPTVHHGMISLLWMELNRILPSHYIADIGERVYLMSPPKDLYPDVYVLKKARKKKRNGEGMATTATLAVDSYVEVEFPPEQIHEIFIQIHLTDEPGRLITVIEVLSPSNKTAGEGHRLYVEKQSRLLESQTHLIEIDLLRAGQHTVAVPRERLPEEGWDYLVCLHGGGWQNKFRYWPIALPDRLPRFSVPLAANDSDVVVDLQALLNQCYAAGKFDLRLDYLQACPPPLSKKNAKWVNDRLREKKLRK